MCPQERDLGWFLVTVSCIMPPMIIGSPLFTRTVVFAERFVVVGPTSEVWSSVESSAPRNLVDVHAHVLL